MLPNPLQPAVVHFPVVLAFLLPLFARGGLWRIRHLERVVGEVPREGAYTTAGGQ